MTPNRRQKTNGIIFIIDFLFIISFYVLAEPTPAVRVAFRGSLPDYSFYISDKAENIRKNIKGPFLSFQCANYSGVENCRAGQVIHIYGSMYELISEVYLLSCAFERKICDLEISIVDGKVDSNAFFMSHFFGNEIRCALDKTFRRRADLVAKPLASVPCVQE